MKLLTLSIMLAATMSAAAQQKQNFNLPIIQTKYTADPAPYVHGDTVYLYKYKNIYRDRVKTDTLYINRCDSIAVPYPVEKKLTFWEENLIRFGKLFVVFFFLAVVVAIGYFI